MFIIFPGSAEFFFSRGCLLSDLLHHIFCTLVPLEFDYFLVDYISPVYHNGPT